LTPKSFWENSSKLVKRPSGKEITINQDGEFYDIIRGNSPQNAPIVDYIVNQRTFDTSKIPLFFIYKTESKDGNEGLFMQYKVNDSINYVLKDVEIMISFKKPVDVNSVQCNPPAFKQTEMYISWRA